MRLATALYLLLLLTATEAATTSTPQTTTLKIYYSNDKLNRKGNECDGHVYAVKRVVPKTAAVARAALEQLFAGPTAQEKAKGYESFFSAETASILKSLKIEKGTAYVNFKEIRSLLGNATTSCGSTRFFAEVETTLKQFHNVKRIVYAIENKPEAFYNWMQIGCDDAGGDCDETPFN